MAVGIGDVGARPMGEVIPLRPDRVKAAIDYRFTVEFERLLVGGLCCSVDLFGKLGLQVVPEGIQDPSARLVLRAAQEHYRRTGRAPGRPAAVAELLKQAYEAGGFSHEQRLAAVNLMSDYEDAPLDDASILGLALPVVRNFLAMEAFSEGAGGIADPEKLRDLSRRLDHAARLGEAVEARDVLYANEQSAAAIEALRRLARMGVGIYELDAVLKGGPQRGRLACLVGEPGAGKSVGLAQVAAHAALTGARVLVATLGEVPPSEWMARVVANVLDIPMENLEGAYLTAAMREAARRFPCGAAAITVGEFTPDATTVEDIEAWALEEQRQRGPAQVLVVDYMDQLVDADADTEYLAGKKVATKLRGLARRPDLDWWVWTASQPQRREGNGSGKKKIGINQLGGSMAKARIADLVITLNFDEDTRLMTWFVAKFRSGPSLQTVGPLPVCFENGQIGPVVRERWEPGKIAGGSF